MAKTETAVTPMTASRKPKKNYDDWQVRDAMHAMLRAGEIVKDRKLLALVRKEAASQAQKMKGVAQQAASLAKTGRISPKALAKMGGV